MPSTTLRREINREMETLKTDALPGGRRATYWLVVERGLDLPEALIVGDHLDEEALAVFSFEEEALLFLSVHSLTGGWIVKEVAVAELASILLDPRPTRIALDLLPAVLGGQIVGLLSMPKERFLRDLVRKRAFSATRLRPSPIRGCGE